MQKSNGSRWCGDSKYNLCEKSVMEERETAKATDFEEDGKWIRVQPKMSRGVCFLIHCENCFIYRYKYKDKKPSSYTISCIYDSKYGSSSRAVNTGEVWGNVSHAQKVLCMSCQEFGTKIQT